VQQQVALVFLVNRMHAMGDGRRHAVGLGDLDFLRIAHELAGQGLDLGREGGREQQGLAFAWQCAEDPLHAGQEAHVEHAVGLVQHDDFNCGKVNTAALHVIEQASRCCHQDIDATTQRVDLRAHSDPAEDGDGARVQMLAVVAHAFLDLGRKLARWRQHQCAWLAA
jgi:hypothetical protein